MFLKLANMPVVPETAANVAPQFCAGPGPPQVESTVGCVELTAEPGVPIKFVTMQTLVWGTQNSLPNKVLAARKNLFSATVSSVPVKGLPLPLHAALVAVPLPVPDVQNDHGVPLPVHSALI